MHGLTWIVTSLCGQQQTDVISFRLVLATEWEQDADLCSETEGLHHGLSCSGPCPASRQGDIGPGQQDLGDKSLAHPLRAMAGERMRDFMTQNGSEAGFVLRDREDPVYTAILPPGRAKAFMVLSSLMTEISQ